MVAPHWQPRLAGEAERDLLGIVKWTAKQFGSAQADLYREIVLEAVRQLRFGPDQLGIRKRDDLSPGVMTIHVARRGRHGRHFVVFRVDPTKDSAIEVLRILHDSMDLARHLPGAEKNE